MNLLPSLVLIAAAILPVWMIIHRLDKIASSLEEISAQNIAAARRQVKAEEDRRRVA